MKGMIKKIFIEHPASVNESYLQHLLFASTTSLKMIATALMLFAHALVPCLFKTTGSDFIIRMYKIIAKRNTERHEQLIPR